MKRKLFSTPAVRLGRLLTAAVGGMTLLACADHYDGDESWVSSVRNAALQSPASITITPSPDGSTMQISWPVVYGAGGYEVTVYDLTNDKVASDTIDGCSLTVTREEDTNYRAQVRTLGNSTLNNTAAAAPLDTLFNTFTPTFATIPAGDLKEFFDALEWPADTTGMLCFDLEGDSDYTLSGNVDVEGHQVTIRCTDKKNHARLAIAAGAHFTTYAGFTLKYIDIDASQATKAIVEMSEEPNDSIKDLLDTNKGWYFVLDPIVYQGCNIKSLGTSIIATNSTKYNIRNFTVTDCVVEIDATTPGANAAAFVYMKAGYITDFTLKQSTVYSKEHDTKFFIQHGGRPRDLGDGQDRKVAILNSTLANLTWAKNFCDYHNGQTYYYYTLRNCIVQDCGKPNFVTGLNKGQASNNPVWDINNNTFWRAGADASELQTGVPSIGFFLTTDPEIDPAAGDLTPAAAQQEAGQGDPRWYESATE